jgi:hypothetical protein
VDLRAQLRRKEWEKQNRWVLSKDDLDRIAADIWPRLAGPELAVIATVKGKVPKKPSLTYEARLAIEAASESISSVHYKIDDLSEPALKGFVFEAWQADLDLLQRLFVVCFISWVVRGRGSHDPSGETSASFGPWRKWWRRSRAVAPGAHSGLGAHGADP